MVFYCIETKKIGVLSPVLKKYLKSINLVGLENFKLLSLKFMQLNKLIEYWKAI